MGQLETVIGALQFISSEIRYSAAPVTDILKRLSALPEYRELHIFNNCSLYLEQCSDIRESWRNALVSAAPKLALRPGDYDALERFGETFGATDVEGQTANCEGCVRLLQCRLDEAREDERRRGRMYFSMGLLAGAFAVVILI